MFKHQNKEKISVIIPVYNEEGNLKPLLKNLEKELQSYPFEIILIDDGSQDGSVKEIKSLQSNNRKIKLIKFKKNFGQSAAMAAGFEAASGDIIIPMDGDGQNDPRDIPRLLDKLKEGYDVVSGWRKDRQDFLLTRLLPSWTANFIISKVTGVHLHDYGCTLKAYRSNLIKNIQISGEMHRFLPAWCAWRGGKITEIDVRHHARTIGNSKYGILRIFNVLIELLTVKFFSGYLSKPNFLFSGVAFALILGSMLSAGLAFADKFIFNQFAPYRIPLLLLSIYLGIVAILLILLGFLSELLVRIYFLQQNQKPYVVEHEVND